MSDTATISKFSPAACFLKAGMSASRVRSENPTMPTRTRSLAPMMRVCDDAGPANARPAAPAPAILMNSRREEGIGMLISPNLELGTGLSDLHVAVPDPVAMILQKDMPVLQLSKPLDALELALVDGGLQVGRLELILQHFRAVQPVLDGLAPHDDPRKVEFAGRLDRAVRGRQDVVERRRLPLRAQLRIRMPLVVDDLVLVADRRVAILQHEVL